MASSLRVSTGGQMAVRNDDVWCYRVAAYLADLHSQKVSPGAQSTSKQIDYTLQRSQAVAVRDDRARRFLTEPEKSLWGGL